MAKRNLVIVKVVSRRNFHNTRAKPRVNRLIRDHFYLKLPQESLGLNLPADIIFIPLVAGIYRKRRIAELRLGSDGRDTKRPILHIVKRIFLFNMPYLQIRKSGLVFHAPVYQPLIAVDKAVLIHLDKCLLNLLYNSLIKREFFPRPIAGGAQLPKLMLHDFLILQSELKHLSVKFLAGNLKTVPTFLF